VLELTAAEIASGVGSGELDAVELVESCLAAMSDRRDLNAVITVCAEQALARARSRPSGPLAGVPLLVKDLLDTEGVRTTYGSRIYAEHVPRRTAPAVRRLEDAGAIVLGKANLHEFAWGVTSQNPHWGTVQNPRLPGRTAGGSSGGNAAALAAGLCALGLGSDTGCSVRLPSACCGTVGYKPTWGAVPTEGCFPLCPSFDTVGPMARSVRDCALAFSVLTGRPVPEPRLKGLRIGVLVEAPRVDPAAEPIANDAALAYVERLEALGARVVEAELPPPEADTWPLFYAEASASHSATFPARSEEYGENVRAKLEHARRLDAAAAIRSREAVSAWRTRTAGEPGVDLVLCPTLGIEPPPVDADELEIRIACTAFARPFNILGWGAVAIGDLQLAGRDDALVLGAALAWEEAYGPPDRW